MGRWLAIWMFMLALPLHAQEAGPSDDLLTIHAYANLIQLPTLVLDRWGDPVKPHPGQKFMVSLDGLKPFPATQVRLEGEDPITLTVLIDASGSQRDLTQYLAEALAKLAPASLTARDHVTIYALDCTVVRTLHDVPAAAGLLKKGVTDALNLPSLHGPKQARCTDTRKLWDTLAFLSGQMEGLPGRRVILAVTDGYDHASQTDWKAVRALAHHYGVAIFGLGATGEHIVSMGRGPTVYDQQYANRFDSLCQLSGGKVLTAQPANLQSQLRDFVKLLRARYIVQFPRAVTMGPGQHDLLVTVAGRDYMIRPAGASVPIAGASETAAHALATEQPEPPAASLPAPAPPNPNAVPK